MDTFVILLPLTVIVACTWPYRSLTAGPVTVRVVTLVVCGVAVAVGCGAGVATAAALVLGVLAGNALRVDDPGIIAWSMTRAAVADGIATA